MQVAATGAVQLARAGSSASQGQGVPRLGASGGCETSLPRPSSSLLRHSYVWPPIVELSSAYA
ncbi:hypothetical protein HaLaN_10025, partial [Haematococcus lacustris]